MAFRKALFTAAALGISSLGLARPEFVARIPNGNAADSPTSGITCAHLGHEGCIPGAPRNPFGLDFKEAGLEWTKELCEKDSDGDGVPNGQELGDPCCLWTPEDPNPPGFRVTNLSHPGDSSEDGSINVPGCPDDVAGQGPATGGPTREPAKTEPAKKEPAKIEPGKESEKKECEKDCEKESGKKESEKKEPAKKETAKKETAKNEPAKKEPAKKEPGAASELPSGPAAPAPPAPGPASDYPSEPAAPAPPTGDTSTCYNQPCPPGGEPCCDGNQCTESPWEGPSEARCLPIPPQCYESNARCAGEPGYTFVPYADCCDPSEVCLKGESDWGSFCKPAPPGYDGSAPMGNGTSAGFRDFEAPVTMPAPGAGPRGDRTPVTRAAPVTGPTPPRNPVTNGPPGSGAEDYDESNHGIPPAGQSEYLQDSGISSGSLGGEIQFDGFEGFGSSEEEGDY